MPAKNETTMGSARLKHILYYLSWLNQLGVPNTVIATGLGVHVNTLRTWLGRAPKKDTKSGDALRKYLAEHWGVTHLWPASE